MMNDQFSLDYQKFTSHLSRLCQQGSTDFHHGSEWFSVGKDHLPEYGWKIHIASSIERYFSLLDLIVPYLLKRNLSFKIPSHANLFYNLNSGIYGFSQIGKNVTIYSCSEDQTICVFKDLRQYCQDEQAPVISSDFYYSEKDSIAIRFGEIATRHARYDEAGRSSFVLQHKSGETWVDKREGGLPRFISAPQIDGSNSFLRSESQDLLDPTFSENSEIIRKYGRQGKRIYLLEDKKSKEKKLVKQATRNMGALSAQGNYQTMLENEYRVIEHLSGVGIAPMNKELIHSQRNLYLVQNDLKGDACDRFPMSIIRSKIQLILRVVRLLHEKGVVHLDLKLANFVLQASSDKIKVIDFETSRFEGELIDFCLSTPGYQAPEYRVGSVADTAMDIYALGGVLVHLALGVCPSRLPFATRDYPHLLRTNGFNYLAEVVERCTHLDPTKRPSAKMLEKMLLARHFHPEDNNDLVAHETDSTALEFDLKPYKPFARRINSAQISWTNDHLEKHVHHQGINIGASGIIIGIHSLNKFQKKEDHVKTIDLTAQWLISQKAYDKAHGLYTGNSGVSLALTLASLYTGNESYLDEAIARLQLASQNVAEAELFSGRAGVLYTVCLIASLTGRQDILELGTHLAQNLKDGIRNFEGVLAWELEGILGGSQYPTLGASHGSAGVAMALYHWGVASQDHRAIELALLTFYSLFESGQTPQKAYLRHDVSSSSKGTPNTNWCHGFAGLLWCLLNSCGIEEDFAVGVQNAVDRFFQSFVVSNPTLCHGLAGQLELCLMLSKVDLYRERSLHRRDKIVSLLYKSFNDEKGLWPSERNDQFTPDLMVGSLGPHSVLAANACHSHDAILSSAWLRPM